MGRFRTIIDASYEQRPTTTRRWEKTLELLPKLDRAGRVLDLGDRTRLTELLEKKWKCQITNSNGDLDIIEFYGEYDVVTSFEVIEHLFNPLYNLLQVRKVLKPGGRLFLTTPLGKPYFLWSPQHFHEMHWERLASLLERAGYQILPSDALEFLWHLGTFQCDSQLLHKFRSRICEINKLSVFLQVRVEITYQRRLTSGGVFE
ncbi:hypothetical protein ES703_36980 [subsurface metagenome]